MRNSTYRPRLVSLEDRIGPGSIHGALDASLVLNLDPALATSLTREDADNLVPVNLGSSDQTAAAVAGVAVLGSAQDGQLQRSAGDGLILLGHDPLQNALDQVHLANGIGTQGVTVVNLGFLPDSVVSTNDGSLSVSFGNDPPTDGWDNVAIDGSGNVSGGQSDFHIGAATLTATFHFTVQLRAQSDLSGTYDVTTGIMTASLNLDAKITSNDAPGFNNNTCIIPQQTLNLDTVSDPLGVNFSADGQGRETGTIVDHTVPLDAIPHGACGSFVGIDYADEINGNLGLPSGSGHNLFQLNTAIDQPIGP